jgi:flavin-dependent dehydrogenase
MKIPKNCDVIVIGGGPSGSQAGASLARKGFNVVLLEKAKHPRPMVGENLIPHFWRYTDQVGVSDLVKEEGFVEKSGGAIFWDGVLRRLRFSDFDFSRPGLHVERNVFDKILLDNARQSGVQVFEEVQVIEVEVNRADNVLVNYKFADGTKSSISSLYVIDASGQAAVVGKQLGTRKYDDALRFMALWGAFRKGNMLSFDAEPHPVEQYRSVPPLTLVSGIGDWGWVWQIVLKEKISVGVILTPSKFAEFKASSSQIADRFQEVVKKTPLIGNLMRDSEFLDGSLDGIKNYSYRQDQLVINRTFLVGDAAAFVDPINSAGVVFGMYAAQLAAECVARALHRPERADRQRELFQHQYTTRLNLFRLLAVPPGRLKNEDYDRLREAIALYSKKEQELMLVQATLSNRSEPLRKIFEEFGIDSSLLYESKLDSDLVGADQSDSI